MLGQIYLQIRQTHLCVHGCVVDATVHYRIVVVWQRRQGCRMLGLLIEKFFRRRHDQDDVSWPIFCRPFLYHPP
jgi:hypothetical protein